MKLRSILLHTTPETCSRCYTQIRPPCVCVVCVCLLRQHGQRYVRQIPAAEIHTGLSFLLQSLPSFLKVLCFTDDDDDDEPD